MTNEQSDDRLQWLLRIIDAEILQASAEELLEALASAGPNSRTSAREVRNLIKATVEAARIESGAPLPWMGEADGCVVPGTRK